MHTGQAERQRMRETGREQEEEGRGSSPVWCLRVGRRMDRRPTVMNRGLPPRNFRYSAASSSGHSSAS